MKYTKYLAAAALSVLMCGCELIQPDDIINPNVSEETFLNTPNAMKTWVNGANRSFATTIGSYAELTELLSDNYFNNYTQSSKVFDIPTILYTDIDVTNLQRFVATLRESANKGIDVVAIADTTTTSAQLFNLSYIKGYSFLLSGENFLGLPFEVGGEVKDWKSNLNMAIDVFKVSMNYAASNNDKAFINTLLARSYYKLGDKVNAVAYANAALSLSADFVKQVVFDGNNGVSNSLQGYVYGTGFQPLPRLDFLDPKYFKITSLEQRPICIAKAEECYLILAEAKLADNDLLGAKQQMLNLLTLVKNRPVQTAINDQLEGRFNGGFKTYPNSSDYKIAASSTDSFRVNLILNRQVPNLISIPYISGTSVNGTMIEAAAATADGLLELIYLMRQEIFFAEGRRSSDLGIRLPVCEIEAANTASAAAYLKAQIPSFIPLNQDMDAFDMNTTNKTVVIKYNMNKIIVANKSSEYVVPFFN